MKNFKKSFLYVLTILLTLSLLTLGACGKDDCESCSKSSECKNDCYAVFDGLGASKGSFCASSSAGAVSCVTP